MKPADTPNETALLQRIAQLEKLVVELLAKCDASEARAQAAEARATAAEARADAAEAKCKKLEDRIAKLEKDSSNSSLPPSSDIAPPPKTPKPKSGKKIGGQPGHEKHTRTPFPPEKVTSTVLHVIPEEEARLRGLTFVCFEKHQQVKLKKNPYDIFEHHRAVYRDGMGNTVHADWKDPTNAGLLCPLFKAMIATLNVSCHASIRNIQDFLSAAFCLPVSTGYLCKVLAQTSESVKPAWEEARDLVPSQKRVFMDETGHKNNGEGKKWWCWAVVADTFTFFAIRASRGRKVALEILTAAFKGLLHSDYLPVYVHIDKDGTWKIQHCLAHLIRDLKWAAEYPDEAVARWGKQVLELVRLVLHLHHQGRRKDAEQARDAVLVWADKSVVPNHEATRPLGVRFREHGERYFRFLWDPLAEPTNNRAERAIRPTVIHRKCTQGTRGDTGQRWWERAWTVVATCRQHGRSAFHFFADALVAKAHGRACPSLMPVAAV